MSSKETFLGLETLKGEKKITECRLIFKNKHIY